MSERISNIDLLYPPVGNLVFKGITLARQAGLNVYAFETLRTRGRQQFLYAQGRTAPGPIVTWAEDSFHEYGLAVDMVFDSDPIKPGPQWTWKGDYLKLAKIMASLGFTTIMKEQAHFQMTFGYQMSYLKEIKAKYGTVGVWEMLNKLAKAKQSTGQQLLV